ncbi:MAG TPA: hypothetical protein VEA81_01915 [Burkholderiaceae bacterium]|nr:hypothetical protein [Burkholderiaceae bacterium]
MPARPDAGARTIRGMDVVAALRKTRPARPAGASELSRVAALLRGDPQAGFAMLARVAMTLEERIPGPEARLEALDALRPALWSALGPALRPLRGQPIPFAHDEITAFHRVGVALRATRDAFVRLHGELCEPGAAPSPRALLALARALDAQSSLLSAACRLRIALPREDWDELCRLAHPLLAAGALDEPFADATGVRAGMSASGTPRAAFAMPLLLRLLEPLGLRGAALDTAGALARASAGRVGVRIELDGRPHVSGDGPSLMLSLDHTVLLDTRAGLSWIGRCAERLGRGASPGALGVRTLLPAGQFGELLERLGEVWGPTWVPTPLVRPPIPQASMILGLPQRSRRASASSADEPAGTGAPLYVYGRGLMAAGLAPASAEGQDPETLRREAIDAAIRALADANGRPVVWRGRDARRAVFARADDAPRLHLGQLVAVLPERGTRRAAPRPGAGPSRLMLGRIVTLAHTGSADGREPAGHDVGVAFWPGSPVPVRVRLGTGTAFEDAWWFETGADGEPPSLVLRRDRVERDESVAVLVRDAAGDRDLRVVGLLERGLDFDRVALAPAA